MTAHNWPVVRRQAEFSRIKSALVGGDGHRGIVLIGDAGVGKTTLARLVTKSLPTRVQWVAGTESARSIPLGVFAHLVGSAAARDPMAFLAAAREAILAEEHSVIGVDDAHMLDQLSATLLHQLAIEGSVRIVATIRDGESVPDAITSLWKDGYLERLHLAPFTKDQCVGLIDEALGSRVEGLSADLMWEASGGNALFVRHLVEGALEAGTLKPGARGMAAARTHCSHLRIGIAAGRPDRSAARGGAACAAPADFLRTARSRRIDRTWSAPRPWRPRKPWTDSDVRSMATASTCDSTIHFSARSSGAVSAWPRRGGCVVNWSGC